MIYLLSVLIAIVLPAVAFAQNYAPSDWPQIKGTHFIVIYPTDAEEATAKDVLNAAERYYTGIADDIGYTRYQNFWTWEERVKIIIYRDQNEYSQRTGQPAWSVGFSSQHQGFYKTRTIVSFKAQPNFLTDLLPHEITHLVLHDFIGFNRSIPLFFDEGTAQLEQVRDPAIHYEQIVAHLIAEQKTIAVPTLVDLDIRGEQDSKTVAIFYAESLYIIDFLVKTYGKENFRDLCRHLRDGDSFEVAFKASYPSIQSLSELELQWTKYMMKFI